MWETKTEAMVLFCKINSVKWFCSIFATLDEKGSGIRCVQQLPAASRLVQVIAALPCGWGGGVDTSVNSLKEGNGVKHISPLVGLLFRAFWRTINEPLCSPNMCSLGGGGGCCSVFKWHAAARGSPAEHRWEGRRVPVRAQVRRKRNKPGLKGHTHCSC